MCPFTSLCIGHQLAVVSSQLHENDNVSEFAQITQLGVNVHDIVLLLDGMYVWVSVSMWVSERVSI